MKSNKCGDLRAALFVGAPCEVLETHLMGEDEDSDKWIRYDEFVGSMQDEHGDTLFLARKNPGEMRVHAFHYSRVRNPFFVHVPGG